MARCRPRRVLLFSVLVLALSGCAEGGPQVPPTPRGLTATPGNGAVTLSWPSDQPDQYTLYWSTSAGVDTSASQLSNVASPYQHTGLENGVRVYYRLMSRNDVGKSDLSPEVSAVPHADATSPGAPASVIATPGDGKVTLTWGLVPDATAYTLYRDTQPGVRPGTGTAIPSVGAPPYDDLNLTNGVTYYYVLTAWTNGKESLPSAEVNATPIASGDPPPAPTGLKAAAGDGQVTLTWSAVSGADSYTLYWGTATGVTPQSGTAIPAATSPHLHPGLQNNTTYYYVVTASRAGLESPASAEASATPTSATSPAPPTDLAATAGDAMVTLTWSPVTGASSYNLYFGTTSGVTPQNGTKLAGVTSPYPHGGLVNGQTYYYVVTTVDPNGESPPSGEASATPNATPTHGTVSSFLPGGAYAVVLFENLVSGKGLVQLMVYNGDPYGSPPGTGVSGLTVTASGTVSGPLLAGSTAGLYQNTTSTWLTSGAYTFTVKGSITGTVTAAVNDVPTCTVTGPTGGSALPAGKDLTLAWSSTNSDKAQLLLQDAIGTTTYPPLTPDPGQATVPGADIPNKGTLAILVSAVWSAKATGGGLLFLGDCGVQVVLQ